MGKERDAKRSRSSNGEGAEMRSLIYMWIMMKGGGISEWPLFMGCELRGFGRGLRQ